MVLIATGGATTSYIIQEPKNSCQKIKNSAWKRNLKLSYGRWIGHEGVFNQDVVTINYT